MGIFFVLTLVVIVPALAGGPGSLSVFLFCFPCASPSVRSLPTGLRLPPNPDCIVVVVVKIDFPKSPSPGFQ